MDCFIFGQHEVASSKPGTSVLSLCAFEGTIVSGRAFTTLRVPGFDGVKPLGTLEHAWQFRNVMNSVDLLYDTVCAGPKSRLL